VLSTSAVTETPQPRSRLPDVAGDTLAGGLLIGFIGMLFLGYFDPQFPYNSLATFPLVGSLVLLFWMNRRADQTARTAPNAARV
jgi:predicted lipid-binding transport protein (Tim44 family)